MYVSTEWLVREVMKISDELGDFLKKDLITGAEPETAEARILATVPIVGGAIIDKAPLSALSDALPLSGEIHVDAAGRGYLELPEDFRRLSHFRMSDWDHGVTIPTEEESLAYRLQWSPVAGLRATPQRPLVAITKRKFGARLEFFGSRGDDAYMASGLYVPTPVPGEGRFFFPRDLIPQLLEELGIRK